MNFHSNISLPYFFYHSHRHSLSNTNSPSHHPSSCSPSYSLLHTLIHSLSHPTLPHTHTTVRARVLQFMMATGVRLPPPPNDFSLLTGYQINNQFSGGQPMQPLIESKRTSDNRYEQNNECISV